MVLEELEMVNERHDLSAWASVSKEWQSFFEPQNFHHLQISYPGSDVDYLDHIINSHRRNYIRKVSLHVVLEEYDSTHGFDQPEITDTIRANNKLFSQALKQLFNSLSAWIDRSSTGGIELELSASSPSDEHHPRSHRVLAAGHDLSRVISLNSKRRLLGNLLDLSSGKLKLDQVSIVSHLSVTRHCYRSMSRTALAKILSSLCRLQTISYEPWRAVGPWDRGHLKREEAMIMLFECVSKSATVKEVSLWEAQSCMHKNPSFPRFANAALVSSAVNASYNLQGFTQFDAVNANDFFRHASMDEPGNPTGLPNSLRIWPALQYLGLTMQIGDQVSLPSSLECLLLEASRAALRMPLLEAMEIVAPGDGEGFAFSFKVGRDSALLTVVSTWQLALSRKVVRSWRSVASRCAQREFAFENRVVNMKSPNRAKGALRLMRLLRERR
ncbi:hypothetical protein CORC01_05054 [Colletotrichum orchidophilum]|uniref:DUF6546 domain-containing protein n=1 Tax=Colletotrichum orchidophilum TaxID=1209926 RepID=A0A1G4BEE5_9PEZI|nr:uncharacterized protein CORC01_05054 [Colletotrichum orchidophilum]OHE99696.1 hypothetical protein CORC01_05054 [Colletotrichum orchidophilum]